MKRLIKTTGWLAMAAAIIFGTAACSSDDDIVNEQPVNPTAPKTYTMTIQASKGDDATTRGLYFADGEASKDLRVNWNGKEKVRVVQDGKVIGTLSAAMSSDESTTLTGTVTGFQNNHYVGFYLLADENGKMDSTGQKGAMLDDNGTGNIEENYDFASYELTGSACMEAFTTDGSNIVPKDGIYIPFTSQQAIVRFELQKSDGSTLYASKFIVTDKNAGNKLVQSIDTKTDTKTYGHVTLTPSGLSTSSIYYVAMNLEGNTSDIRLFASDNEGNLYTYEKSNVTFEKGKYYRVKVKMSLCTKFPLSQITHEDTQFTGWYIGSTISDGDTENCAYNSGGSGVNAVIAYVGKVPGYFDNFLAMSMHDSKKDGTEGCEAMNMNEALTAAGSYATNHSITIGSTVYNTSSNGSSAYDQVEYHIKYHNTDPEPDTYPTNTATGNARPGWRVPTVTDWRYVFEGLCGSPSATNPVGIRSGKGPYSENTATLYTKLNSKFGSIGKLVEGGYYWTGSVESSSFAWFFSFNTGEGTKGFFYLGNGNNYFVRPVFAY